MSTKFINHEFLLRLRSVFRKKSSMEVISEAIMHIEALPELEQILAQPDSLPEDCRRFFLPMPLEGEDLLVGRDDSFKLLDEALRHWQNGHPTSVAVVGPQGCGKTSLINCFQKRQQGQVILRGDLERRLRSDKSVVEFFCQFFQIDPPIDDVEELIRRLMEVEPRIVILEGAHNILLRVIGARKAAETFLYVILRTRRRHFWLLACRRLPWNNMERHIGASRYFSHVLPIDLLPEDVLRDALKLRLENCGLQTTFCSPDESERGRQLAEGQEEKERAFYRGILANSGSNFSSALYFLLLCSRYERNTKSLFLSPPNRLDIAFLKDMDRLHLMTLAELAGHGVLSVGEHLEIFRVTEARSKMTLEYLEQLKLIELIVDRNNSNEKTYDLLPFIHHSVTSALEQLNLLY
ncbi:MAG: hypothetical protein A4E57_01614 [Syntrophorhabdaceae bacterium PtaU1.Bin034]|jgi:hypothetical protein|nr:MAG: hypothetical protein A4E57_01614 [Syntrophorhabdaceae bacterium PtaU1.Bin034]